MSNAFDGRDGRPGSDTVERSGFETPLDPAPRAASLEDGLVGIESDHDAGQPVSTIAGVGGIAATAVVAVGAWASLGGPSSLPGWAALAVGLAVAAAFGRHTRRSVASGDAR